MSPFSHFLHELRMRLEIRQAELAELVGYEQSYISALEVGLKGPPTQEFITRLIAQKEPSKALSPAADGLGPQRSCSQTAPAHLVVPGQARRRPR